MMQKIPALAFAVAAQLLAMANLGCIVAFLADFGVPKTINQDDQSWRL